MNFELKISNFLQVVRIDCCIPGASLTGFSLIQSPLKFGREARVVKRSAGSSSLFPHKLKDNKSGNLSGIFNGASNAISSSSSSRFFPSQDASLSSRDKGGGDGGLRFSV